MTQQNFQASEATTPQMGYSHNMYLNTTQPVDETGVMMMVSQQQDINTQRLQEMVNTANQYRTRACGMKNVNYRDYRDRFDTGKKALPGQKVTQDEIHEQRSRRKVQARKPPVPKANSISANTSFRSNVQKPRIRRDEQVQSSAVLSRSLTPHNNFYEQCQSQNEIISGRNQYEKMQGQYPLRSPPRVQDQIPSNHRVKQYDSSSQQFPTSTRSGGSSSNEPAPREYAPPSPHRDTNRQSSQSLSQFYDDAEFVEFLKQISLFA